MQISKINGNIPTNTPKKGLDGRRNINQAKHNSSSYKMNHAPSFKSGGAGLLSCIPEQLTRFALWITNKIETGGLFVSFTLQDMIGTNIPRPVMGLMRNKKENHGQTNKKFALKELTREMMTGPSMFLIPLGCLTAAKKTVNKSAEIPRMIMKSFGEIHAENPLNSSDLALTSKDFFTKVFEEMIKNAKHEDSVSKETVDKAKDFAQRFFDSVSGLNANEITNKAQEINKLKTLSEKSLKLFGKATNSTKTDVVQEIAYEIADITKQYADDIAHTDFLQSTIKGTQASNKDIMNFMQTYADDVIEKAKTQLDNIKKTNSTDIIGDLTKFIKEKVNNRIVGRVALNFLMYGLVIGFLQIIPKLYNKAEGKGNAGLKGLVKEEPSAQKEEADKKSKKTNPSFGKGKQNSPSFGSIETLAQKLTTGPAEGLKTKILNAFEFEGCNVTFPLLLGIMGLGILWPRTRQAKDKYDKTEILRRDLITCVVMCFGEKIFRKLLSIATEKATGLVFARKPQNLKKFDYLRPIKGVRLLNTPQIVNTYSNIHNYKNGIEGFCDFITQNKGNLSKLFSLDKESEKLLNELLKGSNRTLETASNEEIRNVLSNAKDSEAVKKIMQLFESRNNPWIKKIKTINAQISAAVICLIIPIILGFGLPAINSLLTKKKVKEENMLKEGMNNSHHNNYDYKDFMLKDAKAKNIFGEFIQ